MKQFQYTVKDPNGIHSRPAGDLCKLAQTFQSSITIAAENRSCDLKKTMKVMLLNIKQGETVTITAEGPDEESAANLLFAHLASHF